MALLHCLLRLRDQLGLFLHLAHLNHNFRGEEAEEDDELREVQRSLYDFMLALGGPLNANDATAYLKQAKKKLGKLRRASELFLEIQPEISSHTNFQMAARSLQDAVTQVGRILEQPTD